MQSSAPCARCQLQPARRRVSSYVSLAPENKKSAKVKLLIGELRPEADVQAALRAALENAPEKQREAWEAEFDEVRRDRLVMDLDAATSHARLTMSFERPNRAQPEGASGKKHPFSGSAARANFLKDVGRAFRAAGLPVARHNESLLFRVSPSADPAGRLPPAMVEADSVTVDA